jgi:bifunctional non-homologous end joining protein LigD
VVEVARAQHKQDALAALERWKARHPDVVPHLEPSDILVDGMRGRSSLWYRVRVNLIHVPAERRPGQEALDADYDPWAGFEWPDRSGQPARASRKGTAPTD